MSAAWFVVLQIVKRGDEFVVIDAADHVIGTVTAVAEVQAFLPNVVPDFFARNAAAHKDDAEREPEWDPHDDQLPVGD